MDIKFALSKSGHDKDSIYVIMKEEADMVYLADGRRRPLEKPKKKNKKHIQKIEKLPKEITEVFTQENFRNEEIKRAIKLYQKRRDGLCPDAGNEMNDQEGTECQKQMSLR